VGRCSLEGPDADLWMTGRSAEGPSAGQSEALLLVSLFAFFVSLFVALFSLFVSLEAGPLLVSLEFVSLEVEPPDEASFGSDEDDDGDGAPADPFDPDA
jgi:hypothetical protein